MVRKLRNNNAQNLIEYAIIIALISAAVTALSLYVYRAIQAQQEAITQEAQS